MLRMSECSSSSWTRCCSEAGLRSSANPFFESLHIRKHIVNGASELSIFLGALELGAAPCQLFPMLALPFTPHHSSTLR